MYLDFQRRESKYLQTEKSKIMKKYSHDGIIRSEIRKMEKEAFNEYKFKYLDEYVNKFDSILKGYGMKFNIL